MESGRHGSRSRRRPVSARSSGRRALRRSRPDRRRPRRSPRHRGRVGAGEGQGARRWKRRWRELRPLETLLVLDNFERLLDAAPVVARAARAGAATAGARDQPRAAPARRASASTPCQPIDVGDGRPRDLRQPRAGRRPGVPARRRHRHGCREICAALDGLPLALELAAARVTRAHAGAAARAAARAARRSSAAASATYRNANARSARRSTGATTCSTPREQQLFARLAVFAGGCTLDAAEQSATRSSTRFGPARQQSAAAHADTLPHARHGP